MKGVERYGHDYRRFCIQMYIDITYDFANDCIIRNV